MDRRRRRAARVFEAAQGLHGRQPADRLLVGDSRRGYQLHDLILVGLGAAMEIGSLSAPAKALARTSPSVVV